MDKIWEKIKEYDVITIFGHVIPDGDCYGSQMGLKNAILDNFEGKKVYALGSGWPKFFSLMAFAAARVRSTAFISGTTSSLLPCSATMQASLPNLQQTASRTAAKPKTVLI